MVLDHFFNAREVVSAWKDRIVVLSSRSSLVLDAVKSSIGAGAKAIIVITAGFKETGEDGQALEKELIDVCAKARVRLMGPNCLGLINTQHKLNASFARQMPLTGSFSVISQSGALCTAILDYTVFRGIGMAKLISIGNKADLSENDFLSVLAEDDDTKVIACYIESIVMGDEFVRVAEAAASVKPVVILKVGTTETGSKAASSHTGSLAGTDIAYGAAFRRGGVIRADAYEALIDYSRALSLQPLPKGDRVAIITNAGGPGIMAADAVENAGLTVAPLNESLAAALKSQLPAAAASPGSPPTCFTRTKTCSRSFATAA